MTVGDRPDSTCTAGGGRDGVGHQVRPARRPPPAGWANYYKFDGIDWPTSAARSGTLGWLIERRQKFRDSALLLVSRGGTDATQAAIAL